MRNLFSLLGGIAAGALIGLLFAPQSGKETRDKIKELLEEKMPNLSKEKLEQLVDQVIAKAKGLHIDVEVKPTEDDGAEA
ncbi:MAG: YtxH domain-containing protein [Paludibacter sp.]|nr:YtxH domain-containing protein [Bacteroidales bacterium]MCM1069562.1 YtxH domain-containing protein [Prevotella sp.]MCM1354208.1 YtxH domain-containing protein [Bacteroides sp.]MCM1443053.1 YtxH domain-containing protein [Muribaculum sp.]MCM1482282.1 YtxH domain-containing protein [Paludibacter sp.]